MKKPVVRRRAHAGRFPLRADAFVSLQMFCPAYEHKLLITSLSTFTFHDAVENFCTEFSRCINDEVF